jgi:hypothetical protein
MRPLDLQTMSAEYGSLSNFEHSDGLLYSNDPNEPGP